MIRQPGTISPLSLNPLTRDLWPNFDPMFIAQIADYINDDCYQIKFYKAPPGQQELFPPNAFVSSGLRITPGDIIVGFGNPMIPVPGALPTSAPGSYTVQITDTAIDHQWFDAPLASIFLSNYKPTQQSNAFSGAGSFFHFLTSPYPVTGAGLFMIDIQESSGIQQRIELIFVCLEVCQSL